jgi:redox-sensitive bicupin YhaK (pirin superfamily)
VHINQDVKLYASILSEGETVSYDFAEGRHAWIQLISGSLDANGEILNPGDGAAASQETELIIKALTGNSEFLLFDLN